MRVEHMPGGDVLEIPLGGIRYAHWHGSARSSPPRSPARERPLAVAGAFAFPVNRRLLARGKGHAAVHETGIHGGPDVRIVGIIAVLAFVFGATVLILDAVGV
jgi:hypothetical protein